MNSHTSAINIDKIITVLVTIVIIGYLVIFIIRSIDFTKIKKTVSQINEELYFNDIRNYLNSRDDYYYQIEGSVYCITSEEINKLDDISNSFKENIGNHTIEAKYINGNFNIIINDECIEK